jgi:hypothetical protein
MYPFNLNSERWAQFTNTPGYTMNTAPRRGFEHAASHAEGDSGEGFVAGYHPTSLPGHGEIWSVILEKERGFTNPPASHHRTRRFPLVAPSWVQEWARRIQT